MQSDYMPSIEPVHIIFDLVAIFLAMLGGWFTYRWRLREFLALTAAQLGPGYFVYLWLGSVLGAYGLGTFNLFLSGVYEIGRSILGSIFGAIVAVEIYKFNKNIKNSTGYIYVVPLCILIIVGRWGCFLSGLSDNTYGTPTSLPWGWDFGDEIPRHPVQLYESLSMFIFLLVSHRVLTFFPLLFIRYGFYACIGYYAMQRWVWEFFKPYGKVDGLFNIFHYCCFVLLLYSTWMCLKEGRSHAAT